MVCLLFFLHNFHASSSIRSFDLCTSTVCSYFFTSFNSSHKRYSTKLSRKVYYCEKSILSFYEIAQNTSNCHGQKSCDFKQMLLRCLIHDYLAVFNALYAFLKINFYLFRTSFARFNKVSTAANLTYDQYCCLLFRNLV